MKLLQRRNWKLIKDLKLPPELLIMISENISLNINTKNLNKTFPFEEPFGKVYRKEPYIIEFTNGDMTWCYSLSYIDDDVEYYKRHKRRNILLDIFNSF